MEELLCWICNKHIGWIYDSAPRGLPICDECKDIEEDKELEDE